MFYALTNEYGDATDSSAPAVIRQKLSESEAQQHPLAEQSHLLEYEVERLQQERLCTQLQKLAWFRHLAVLKQQIAEYGSNQEQLDYHSLVACENTPLTP